MPLVNVTFLQGRSFGVAYIPAGTTGDMDEDEARGLGGQVLKINGAPTGTPILSSVSGGGGGLPTKIGQVATRTVIPNQLNAGVTAAMNRTVHIARDALVGVYSFRFPNWYVTGAYVEAGSGDVMTLTASVEYPIGTFTQITFSGSSTASVVSGEDVVGTATLNIPKGATFYVRSWQTNPAGIIYQGLSTPVRPGDLNRNNSTQVDQTMDAAFSTVSTGSIYGPTAIFGTTSVKSAFLLGDSLLYGSQDSGDATTDTGIFARAIGGSYPYIQCGVSGDSAVKFVASNAKRLALAQYCDVVFCNYGTNDIWSNARRSDQVIADLITIRNLFPSLRFYQATILPRGASSTDSWVTAAGQTITSTNNNHRVRLNNMIRSAGIPLANGYIAAAEVVESDVNGAGAITPQPGLWKEMGVIRSTTGDGNITSGTNTYTSATAAFTAADTGSLIQIDGAGSAGASLLGMMTFVNGTTVTLTDPAGSGATRNAGTTVTTANARIGVLPLTVDGVHPYRHGYQMIAQSIRDIASLVS